MTAEPDSEIAPKAAASVQDVLHGSIVGIPPAIQDIAAGDALRHANELGNPSSAEITEILVIVTANVLETQITPDAVLDARAQSPLGRRLLQAMKQEVMRSWRMYGITETQLPSLLLALERVREGMENDPARAFASQLGGEGISFSSKSRTTCTPRSPPFSFWPKP